MTTKRLVERFVKYVKIPSASKEGVEDRFPSTPEQLELARILVKDLLEMGLSDATVDEHGYVFATLSGTNPKAPVIGFIAHMDTSPASPGENVKPVFHENYQGGDIVLPAGTNPVLHEKDNPELKNYTGDTVITTDGTTLLGADDKAGIAEILEAAQRLKDDGRPRPDIRIGFTPDEEVGNGTAHFDIKKFGVKYAYTLDGSSAAEVEDETFCADSATVTITGADVHPGYAKGKMINAVRIAARFIELLPPGLCPEYTEGREGYLHPMSFTGDVTKTSINFIVRDFALDGLKEKEKFLSDSALFLMREYPGSKIEVQLKESYRNMKYDLDKDPVVVEMAMKAVKNLGLTPKLTSIRGGTDGSRLSAMGLLTPNIGGGGKNFHSLKEWIAVGEMEKCTKLIMELAWLWGKKA